MSVRPFALFFSLFEFVLYLLKLGLIKFPVVKQIGAEPHKENPKYETLVEKVLLHRVCSANISFASFRLVGGCLIVHWEQNVAANKTESMCVLLVIWKLY